MVATTTGPRKTISIYDYPEHLNPFREEEADTKLRFWTLGRKLKRSNSITFSGIKDLRNSWVLKSFMKKGKKNQKCVQDKPSTAINGESSPVQFRRSLQYSSASTTAISGGERSTVPPADRYVYGGSVTPLPRSRFQERLRSPSQCEVNSLRVGVYDRVSASPTTYVGGASPRLDTESLASDVTGSRLSVESANPFGEGPVPPVRASRRKKKRAPPPPPSANTSVNTTLNAHSTPEENEERVVTESVQLVPEKKTIKADTDIETQDPSLNIELKIIEDDEHSKNHKQIMSTTRDNENKFEANLQLTTPNEKNKTETPKTETHTKDERSNIRPESNDHQNSKDGDDRVTFPKVDIKKYRRNSSFNEDDVRLRRGNLEDFNITAYKRSKSLSNTNDNSIFVTCDINLNTTEEETDANCNEKPKKVVCKLFSETSRKHSVDNSISSTEKEFIEIDKATRELEREINKLNSALNEDDPLPHNARLSVSEIKRKFDNTDPHSPNPIPKPRRSNFNSISAVNGNVKT